MKRFAGNMQLLQARATLTEYFVRRIEAIDAVVFPTTPNLPSRPWEFEHGPAIARLALFAFCTSTLFNVVDGCTVDVPISTTPAVDLRIASIRGRDREPLAIVSALDELLPKLR
jgi:Asp-tRNA(Asn)/Glu-tRNA(Gln) amidotransferase A subunit family amidase